MVSGELGRTSNKVDLWRAFSKSKYLNRSNLSNDGNSGVGFVRFKWWECMNKHTVRIILTGASGFVGRNLIPLLADGGVKLLLVGRNQDVLQNLYPEHTVCDYSSLPEEAIDFDMIVHLAALTPDPGAPLAEYLSQNIESTCEMAKLARKLDVAFFVHISSIQAADLNRKSSYNSSKREAAKRLRSIDGLKIINVHLPMLYGREFSGSVAWLNRLPPVLAKMLFAIAAALKPTVHIQRFAEFLLFDVHKDSDSEIILSDPQAQNPWFYIPKRFIDLGFALSVFLVFWWLLVLIWIAVRIQSPGPGIFSQTRVGKNGKEFICYKFRTMQIGTPQTGTHEVSAKSVTKLGQYLRSSKLDELPQIINILRNEMSLIGPRPSLPSQVELIEVRRKHGILEIKPGISGLAQINGVDMSDPRRLAEWDRRYICLQSLLGDFWIGIATIFGKGQGDRTA